MIYASTRFLKTALLALFFLAMTICSRAQAPAAIHATAKPAAIKPAAFVSAPAIIEKFFKKYKEAGPDSAVDYLFSTNKYFNNPTGASQLKARLDSMRASLGDYIGKDLIVQKAASPSLILYSYLVKHEVQPVRFIFIFYKPHNDWVFYRFLFDDQMDLEMEDAAKISNKHP